jgi:hypothetical protein
MREISSPADELLASQKGLFCMALVVGSSSLFPSDFRSTICAHYFSSSLCYTFRLFYPPIFEDTGNKYTVKRAYTILHKPLFNIFHQQSHILRRPLPSKPSIGALPLWPTFTSINIMRYITLNVTETQYVYKRSQKVECSWTNEYFTAMVTPLLIKFTC